MKKKEDSFGIKNREKASQKLENIDQMLFPNLTHSNMNHYSTINQKIDKKTRK